MKGPGYEARRGLESFPKAVSQRGWFVRATKFRERARDQV